MTYVGKRSNVLEQQPTCATHSYSKGMTCSTKRLNSITYLLLNSFSLLDATKFQLEQHPYRINICFNAQTSETERVIRYWYRNVHCHSVQSFSHRYHWTEHAKQTESLGVKAKSKQTAQLAQASR